MMGGLVWAPGIWPSLFMLLEIARIRGSSGTCVLAYLDDSRNPSGLGDEAGRLCHVGRYAAMLGCRFSFAAPSELLLKGHNGGVGGNPYAGGHPITAEDWAEYIVVPEDLLQPKDWRPRNVTVTLQPSGRPQEWRPGKATGDHAPLAAGAVEARTNQAANRVANSASDVSVDDMIWLTEARLWSQDERSLTVRGGFYGQEGFNKMAVDLTPALTKANLTYPHSEARSSPAPGAKCGSASLTVKRLAARAVEREFRGRPFDVLLLRRGDRTYEYPKCSAARNVARVATSLSTVHFNGHRELYMANCSGTSEAQRSFKREGVSPGAATSRPAEQGCGEHHRKGGAETIVRTILVGTNEDDPEYLHTLVTELGQTYDRVVLEQQLKRHITTRDNYQFFQVLKHVQSLATWSLRFHPLSIQHWPPDSPVVVCPDGK